MQSRRFDVFLCHHGADGAVVERIAENVAERLRGKGVQPWLDRWCLAPGDDWQQGIIEGLAASGACAVFVGSHGLGGWAREELAVAQDRAVNDHDFRLFMVLLPGAPKPDDLSLAFLANRHWVDLRADADGPDVLQALLSALTGVAHRPGPPIGDICPYRGSEVFDSEHAEFFFGRDHDIRRVLDKFEDGRFLAVLGPSGCGKSSLVRAGVIPALGAVRLITPGAQPLRGLAAQLVSLFPGESMQRTLAGLRADEQSLDLAVALALAERPADERFVLVVDQFEELFTLCADEAERAAFLANLCYAATIPGGRLVVVLAMRADFYHRCAPYPDLVTLMAAHQFFVRPLDPEGLREAIERPAWRAGYELQAGLAEAILDDVADRPGSLPLLEHVLLEVWQRRQGQTLTFEAYSASSGVEGALAQRANAIYQALTPSQQAIARRVLLRLIQPGEGTEDTRRRAEMAELLTRPEEQADVEAMVKALTDGRLLTTARDEVTGRVWSTSPTRP
ncbi:MAG: TIR domain-containing protein [Egibacteraceae bacterium]